jgi:hypothetical protein
MEEQLLLCAVTYYAPFLRYDISRFLPLDMRTRPFIPSPFPCVQDLDQRLMHGLDALSLEDFGGDNISKIRSGSVSSKFSSGHLTTTAREAWLHVGRVCT